jgi:hypothetical protein
MIINEAAVWLATALTELASKKKQMNLYRNTNHSSHAEEFPNHANKL